MDKIKQEVIAFNFHNPRTLDGKDLPVRTTVTHIHHYLGETYWLVTYNICNGEAKKSKRFSTRKAALKDLTLYTEALASLS